MYAQCSVFPTWLHNLRRCGACTPGYHWRRQLSVFRPLRKPRQMRRYHHSSKLTRPKKTPWCSKQSFVLPGSNHRALYSVQMFQKNTRKVNEHTRTTIVKSRKIEMLGVFTGARFLLDFIPTPQTLSTPESLRWRAVWVFFQTSISEKKINIPASVHDAQSRINVRRSSSSVTPVQCLRCSHRNTLRLVNFARYLHESYSNLSCSLGVGVLDTG